MLTALISSLVLAGAQGCDPQVALRRPTLLGLEPLRTPFARIDRGLPAPARRLRDPAWGEVAPFAVCLKGAGEGGEAFLLVESSAAGGYGANSVTGFRLSLRPPKGPRSLPPELQPAGAQPGTCAVTRSFDRTTALSNGLKLGMLREEVTALLGRPTETSGTTWRYLDDRRASKSSACPPASADFAELSVTFGPDGAHEIYVDRSDMR